MVPALLVADCGISFRKAYVARYGGRVIVDGTEHGDLRAAETIFLTRRGFDGGDEGILGEKGLMKFPTVILESYRPFTRVYAGKTGAYKYIYFTFDRWRQARAVERNLRLYSLLCGGGHAIYNT